MELKDIKSNKKYRAIVSGGGSGGHFYPAVAIAERLKKAYGEDIDILFVGAYGKMEMEKIPSLGWNIIGINIVGLQRRLTAKNLLLPFKMAGSYIKSLSIISRFKPNIVVGTGGYVTLPILSCAAFRGIPTMIWEGNSCSGMANRVLGRKAKKVFVSYSGMDKYFDAEKIVITGNPLRGGLEPCKDKREQGYDYFSLDRTKPTIFITGGSQGTTVLNRAVMRYFDLLVEREEVNLVWQSGSRHDKELQLKIAGRKPSNFYVSPFIDRMDLAYNVADLVVARSGASTLSEIALIGRASLLVPSSNVPDDHQTKNARSFVDAQAALMTTDSRAEEELIPMALELLRDRSKLELMESRVKQFAEPMAVDKIFNEIAKYIK